MAWRLFTRRTSQPRRPRKCMRSTGHFIPGLEMLESRTSSLTLRTSTVTKNHANGGDAGAGGSAGEGIGGGVYNLGTFDFDAFTLIGKNHATTSNDDIFAPF